MKKIKFLSVFLVAVFISPVLMSCGGDDDNDDDDDLSLSPTEVTIKCKEQSPTIYANVVADSWTIEDDFVARIYAPQKNASSCYVVGYHIGTTRVKATKGGKTVYAMVTVNPQSTLYDTPVLDFSASKASIKSKENHVFTDEDEETLQYRYLSGTHECIVTYYFKENKMTFVSVNIANYNESEIKDFLSERYQADSKVEGLYINSRSRETATLFVMEATSTSKSGKSQLSLITYFPDFSSSTSK